ncbi:MAG: CDP-alcohol phosphatidyltransferase family protein [Terracoccus sp.]
MFDTVLRRRLAGPLEWAAAAIDVRWVSPNRLTAAGLVIGLGSALAAAATAWNVALVLWLVSRTIDGLDGALARHRAGAGAKQDIAGSTSAAGGFLDIVADFIVYGCTVVGVAVGATRAEGAQWWPFLLVLLAYYVNGTAFLAFSSIAERTGRQIDDGRSLSFLGGLAEGAETIVVHSLWLVFPGQAGPIAIGWALVVGVSGAQRAVAGYAALR